MGLVQRVLEADGIPTVSLSMIPEFTRAVGVPRLAGIAYPMSRPMGRPGDDRQREVLRALLDLPISGRAPDAYVEVPFSWPETPQRPGKGQTSIRLSPNSLPTDRGCCRSYTPARFRRVKDIPFGNTHRVTDEDRPSTVNQMAARAWQPERYAHTA